MIIARDITLIIIEAITYKSFLETKTFSKEYFFSDFIYENQLLPNDLINLFDKNNKLKIEKKLALISFFINTEFLCLKNKNFSAKTMSTTSAFKLIILLILLEEMIQEKKDKKNREEKKQTELFFSIKRKIFNIFMYFDLSPKHLDDFFVSLINVNNNDPNMVFEENIKKIVHLIQIKAKRLSLTFSKHYLMICKYYIDFPVNFISYFQNVTFEFIVLIFEEMEKIKEEKEKNTKPNISTPMSEQLKEKKQKKEYIFLYNELKEYVGNNKSNK